MPTLPTYHPTQYWHELEDGRVQCDLCQGGIKNSLNLHEEGELFQNDVMK